MFRFGRDHKLPERSSKQLIDKGPRQWWVLDLDDGFIENSPGKYIKIENIRSVPMRALWEGIKALPWEGPPPIDGKGMMSVMFEATRNTALVIGMPSKYANRNYFMISKHYTSMSSRLGFHFCIVESMISKRANENYASFQFKGGAADYQRRRRRVRFIGDILENAGFRTELNADNLTSRLEGYPAKAMIDRLIILGYLAIHTRQLDMIMGNESKVKYYRSKLEKEIKQILDNKAKKETLRHLLN